MYPLTKFCPRELATEPEPKPLPLPQEVVDRICQLLALDNNTHVHDILSKTLGICKKFQKASIKELFTEVVEFHNMCNCQREEALKNLERLAFDPVRCLHVRTLRIGGLGIYQLPAHMCDLTTAKGENNSAWLKQLIGKLQGLNKVFMSIENSSHYENSELTPVDKAVPFWRQVLANLPIDDEPDHKETEIGNAKANTIAALRHRLRRFKIAFWHCEVGKIDLTALADTPNLEKFSLKNDVELTKIMLNFPKPPYTPMLQHLCLEQCVIEAYVLEYLLDHCKHMLKKVHLTDIELAVESDSAHWEDMFVILNEREHFHSLLIRRLTYDSSLDEEANSLARKYPKFVIRDGNHDHAQGIHTAFVEDLHALADLVRCMIYKREDQSSGFGLFRNIDSPASDTILCHCKWYARSLYYAAAEVVKLAPLAEVLAGRVKPGSLIDGSAAEDSTSDNGSFANNEIGDDEDEQIANEAQNGIGGGNAEVEDQAQDEFEYDNEDVASEAQNDEQED